MIAAIIKYLGLAIGVIGSIKNFFPGTSVANEAAVITKDIENDAAALSDYEAGQAVLVATVTIPGDTTPGHLVAIKQGGSAYAALFGSNA